MPNSLVNTDRGMPNFLENADHGMPNLLRNTFREIPNFLEYTVRGCKMSGKDSKFSNKYGSGIPNFRGCQIPYKGCPNTRPCVYT